MSICLFANLYWILGLISCGNWVVKATYLLVGFVVVADTIKFYRDKE